MTHTEKRKSLHIPTWSFGFIEITLPAWGSSPHGNVFKTVEAIDLTDVKTIMANIEGNAKNQYERILFITYPTATSSIGNDGANTSACLRLGASGDYTIPLDDYPLDVSALSGKHYVGFYIYNTFFKRNRWR